MRNVVGPGTRFLYDADAGYSFPGHQREINREIDPTEIWNQAAFRLNMHVQFLDPPGFDMTMAGYSSHALKIALIAVVLLFSCSQRSKGTEAVPCSEPTARSGNCWNSLTAEGKLIFIDGFYVGMAASLIQSEWINRRPRFFDTEFISYLGTPESSTFADFIDYFDRLYSSPANRQISMANAFMMAAMALRDDDTNDHQKLLLYFRQYPLIPTAVYVLAIEENRLTIKNTYGTFVVAMAGTDYEKLDNKTKDIFNTFLRSIFMTSQWECGRKDPPYPLVRVAFRDDVFDEAGRFSGYVTFKRNQKFCLNNQIHQLDMIFEPGNYNSLNAWLVSMGLLRYQASTDPKWRKNRRQVRGWLRDLEAFAMDDGLYAHGAETVPVVEYFLEEAKDLKP